MYSHPVEPRDTFKSQNRRREEECDGGRGGEKEVYWLKEEKERGRRTRKGARKGTKGEIWRQNGEEGEKVDEYKERR